MAVRNGDKKDKLQALLTGEFGMEILLSTNYNRLQTKILSLVFTILQQECLSLEEKIIVENAIAVWVGITLYKPELFEEFKAFRSEASTAEDFIMRGLILCQEDKIRQDFCQGILALAKSFDRSERQAAQRYFMGILGRNFVRVQPCSQYFDCFSCLIDMQALSDGLSDELSETSSYDPETLLYQIIDKIVEASKDTD